MVVKSQAGMTMLGMLCVVILVVGSMLLLIKIVPLYIDDYAIETALQAMGEETKLAKLKKSKIRKLLAKRLSADYTRELKDDELKIIKGSKELRIEINYESRVSLFYNLDIIARFDHLYVQSL